MLTALVDRLFGDAAARPDARIDGYLPLARYGALGDGRSVVLSGTDGSIDWWCVPNLDSPPLFDRLLDAEEGGRFSLTPDAPFTIERRYRDDSNVLETVFTTDTGRARLTESLNSGTAGRLPWAELARRIEGLEGSVRFALTMRPGRRGDTVNPYHSTIGKHTVFHVERVLGLFVHHPAITCRWSDEGITGEVIVNAGERRTVAIVAGRDEPLVAPGIEEIDARIDLSDTEWRDWAARLTYDGDDRPAFVRSALALKLLLYSPSGAIAAAATTSLPEGIGGAKNFDYRYAWIRDAGYTIKAFLTAGAQAEAKAAFTWLLNQLRETGTRVCYTLDGGVVPDVAEWAMPGYRGSRPVVTGNLATDQSQHGVYGDIFETASCFVASGNILDSASAELLSHLADQCADRWRLPDAGMWELQEQQHYTMSKVSCWQALARAVELADGGQLPTTCRERWQRERDRIKAWIERECWSNSQQSFVMYPGSDKIDASMALAVRFGFDGADRLRLTLDAIDRELGAGPFHYRYTGMASEEGCFLACSFWMVEARAQLGQRDQARAALDALVAALPDGHGVLAEMVDPHAHEFLGNMPQGLSHLAHLMALSVLNDAAACD
ncbi:GH15 family glucan-1,4-alpha-glucosidase [Sphingomonas jinjuensis]|uniref:GH15 family glucan-1,4-alpha-glucosidase n=1 Tax=Sphingomonas jinjuensis TaxID=535907 RepID=A0A840FA23_9SPHN|nr:glycoside hydrolase family 15 protein [Sphingomonas jinjuensis]MBB4154870.1 GH15 family glucan-1,4-alpha-glucosidase [Sphingomonas jinjuensis]